jgi:protein-L-isoaspartate(D-aspartate) O-methyltransferase
MRPLPNKRYWALTLLAVLSSAVALAAGDVDLEAARKAMVAALRGQGIHHAKTLAAMGKVPRHEFVPEAQRSKAYSEVEISLGGGKVLASPYLVALMTQTLDPKPETKVLEICTGCGYQTAILVELSSRVYSVEREPGLAQAASERLKSLGYKSVRYGVGEEAKGWPTHAPYDAILVTGGVSRVPDALVEQLADGGCLVVAIGHGPEQTLNRMRKVKGKLRVEAVIPVRMSSSLPAPRGR